MLTYLTLAYDGNYVGRTQGGLFELFTYGGNLYAADPETNEVCLLV